MLLEFFRGDKMDYQNKTIVVTGAAQGIGAEIARSYAEGGGRVIIADIKEREGRLLEEEIRGKGYIASFIKTDVAREPEVKYMVAEALRLYDSIDILINNAAISYHQEDLLTMQLETWNKIIGINLTGVFLCSKHCGTVMKLQEKGCIINLASTRAMMSEANTEAYSASKGGILALTHALAVSLGGYNIRVNAISPGWIECGSYEAIKPSDHNQHPVGRVGRPRDIAGLCLYLTSEAASFITGANMVVDGGMTVKMIYQE